MMMDRYKFLWIPTIVLLLFLSFLLEKKYVKKDSTSLKMENSLFLSDKGTGNNINGSPYNYYVKP